MFNRRDEGTDGSPKRLGFLSLFLRLFLPMDLKDAASMLKTFDACMAAFIPWMLS